MICTHLTRKNGRWVLATYSISWGTTESVCWRGIKPTPSENPLRGCLLPGCEIVCINIQEIIMCRLSKLELGFNPADNHQRWIAHTYDDWPHDFVVEE